MHCASCALVIESDLEDVGAEASCSYAKQVLSVEFDSSVLTEEMIIATIKKSGYSVRNSSLETVTVPE